MLFLWTDPSYSSDNVEVNSEQERASGHVPARWLALDSILRSLIFYPEGAELRTMMKRDLKLMEEASTEVPLRVVGKTTAYEEAVKVLESCLKSLR